MPKVSVLIPVYGVEKYIERCARSLFEQTLDDIEYIFVDDCTPDRSMEILERVIDEYRPRFAGERKVVRTERMPTNSGLPAVRRHGIQLATGDYIIHCDSDDWMDVTMYEKLYNKAIAEDADMVVCDYVVTDGHGHDERKIGCSSQIRDVFIVNMLFQRDSWSLWNKLIKRSIYYTNVITYPEGALGEDLTTVLQLVWYCKNIQYINGPCYYYYFNTQSITKKQSKQIAHRNYTQLVSNAEILYQFYADKSINQDIQAGLDWIWIRIGHVFLPYLHDRIYMNLWRIHYKSYLLKIISNRHISLGYKLNHIIILMGMYPIYKKFIKNFRQCLISTKLNL